jgi:hypothetical protein
LTLRLRKVNVKYLLSSNTIMTANAETVMEVRTLNKELDLMTMKIMKLRARLLPTEKITAKEKRELKAARARIAKGEWESLEDLAKELG